MPSLRKRKRKDNRTVWDIRYWESGKQRVFTVGETDRRTAEKVYREFCEQLAEGKVDHLFSLPPPVKQAGGSTVKGVNVKVANMLPKKKLSDLAEQTLAYANLNKSPKTAEREATAFMRLVEGIGDIPLEELSTSLVESYKEHRLKVASQSTVNIEIRILNTALRQATDMGWGGLPTKGFKLIRQGDPEPPQWLSRKEIAVLLDAATGDYRRLIEFLLNTGCRRNEALGMRWEDVDIGRRQIVVRGKMGKRRTIPINDELMRVFSDWPGKHTGLLFPKFGPNQISMAFRRIRKEAGLPDGICVHSLRATFACHLIEQGIDIYTVSRLLGHSSVTVTEKHYLALDPAHAKSAVNSLNYTGPPQGERNEQ